jgi:hypothetical protein
MVIAAASSGPKPPTTSSTVPRVPPVSRDSKTAAKKWHQCEIEDQSVSANPRVGRRRGHTPEPSLVSQLSTEANETLGRGPSTLRELMTC